MRPKILIFDEATSNLDGETSERFAATVNKLKGKVTMIFIAHQLSRTLKVDHIVRIDAVEGRVKLGNAVFEKMPVAEGANRE